MKLSTLAKSTILCAGLSTGVTSFADGVSKDLNDIVGLQSQFQNTSYKTQTIKGIGQMYTEIDGVELNGSLDMLMINTVRAVGEQVDKIIPKGVDFKVKQKSNGEIQVYVGYKMKF
ncbi:MAG: hypothetical protein PHH06_01055 [Candidatus Gracilibacteria bacterium]|nr:hypothetical protein [Candidatus Gracilibacteria bacterium]